MRARLLAAALPLVATACIRLIPTDAMRAKVAPPWSPRVTDPVQRDARLAGIWIGHASVLVQLEDRFVLSDPVFSDTVGEVSARLVPPGLDPADLPMLDAVVISHVHMDHLDPASIDRVRGKTRQILVPPGGTVYLPDSPVPVAELPTWGYWEKDGLRITAVPVKHVGGRYALDQAWMTAAFTGYVIEYHGLVVYFAGDTAYDEAKFAATAARFPHIDLALPPIAPIEPRGFMKRVHMDPREATRAFLDLRAEYMVPIHFDTFVQGADEPGDAPRALRRAAEEAHVADRVDILRVGEPRVFF